jgi:signal transduction histidine kinase
MWAGTSGGLLRLDAGVSESSRQPPRVYFEQVLVAGERVPLPEGGVEQPGELMLGPVEGHLVVGFVGVDLHAGGSLRFQHQLAGVDRDWSPETEDTAVHFANLAPGEYRLRVRAAAADGTVSEPVELAFRVLPPLWQRSWFLALLGVLVGLLVWSWHRARLRRAVATERLRTGIATDLHDDLGAGLVQIAILSEVARAGAAPKLSESLSEVAGLARSLRESMTDIVWTMAPGHDRLAALVQRMRQLAGRLLEVEGVRVEFRGPEEAALATPLDIDQRRHLWLWFKEALTNVARHARAATVGIAVSVPGDAVQVAVSDDGCGFDPAAPREGNGLRNLQHRSQSLQGSMQLRSRPGGGTELLLTAPLRRRGRPA